MYYLSLERFLFFFFCGLGWLVGWLAGFVSLFSLMCNCVFFSPIFSCDSFYAVFVCVPGWFAFVWEENWVGRDCFYHAPDYLLYPFARLCSDDIMR